MLPDQTTAMDDVRAELQAAEDEARQQAASLRQRARRLRLRGFGGLADELEAHAVALHETANVIARRTETQLGMALAEVSGHRRRLGVADAVHQQEHRTAAQARDLKPGAAVEHASRLRGGSA